MSIYQATTIGMFTHLYIPVRQPMLAVYRRMLLEFSEWSTVAITSSTAFVQNCDMSTNSYNNMHEIFFI